MGHPLVSIIVNNYNYGRFLGEAIDSALMQDYPDKEVLVVDDGSTDDSRELIAQYGRRIVPLLKENGGQTSAFNAAFKQCRGDIVFFLDADDLFLPGAVTQAVAHFDDPEVVKVHWPLWIVDEQGAGSGQRKPTDPPPQGDLRDQLVEHGPEHPGWPPTSGIAWRREFLARVFPIPEVERHCRVGSASADLYLSMLAPLFGRVAAIEQPMACYRVHGSNDHSCLDFDHKLQRDVWVFDHFSRVLQGFCERAGLSVDPQRWRDNSWCYGIGRAAEELRQHVPCGRPFVLIDDATWCMTSTPKRKPLPFLERDGRYWGAPADDDQAIAELQRMRKDYDVAAIVFAWPSFWWLDHYPEFAQLVESTSRCVLRNQRLIIYDCTQGTKGVNHG